MIFNFSRFVVYEARRRLNVCKICKNYRFKHRITLHAIMKFVFLHLIENVSKVVVWNSDHMNLVYNNAIEINFDDLLLDVLHLSLVFKFDLININSVDSRTYLLRIKLINTYDSNKKAHFYKYVNLRCARNWCSIVWFLNESVHFQTCDDNKRQIIWCIIIRIINNR